MKIIKEPILLLALSLMASCASEQEAQEEASVHAQKEAAIQQKDSPEIYAQVYETPLEPIELPPIYVTEPTEIIELPPIETFTYEHHDYYATVYYDYYVEPLDVSDRLLMISPTPLTDPLAFARSVFDDNSHVVPWLANYVGSYGVLPSRVQDKGPFLYSFDVSPDADILHDDDDGF